MMRYPSNRCRRLARSLDQDVVAGTAVEVVLPRPADRDIMATAPPLTKILPAASRLTVMVLSRASPETGLREERGSDRREDALGQQFQIEPSDSAKVSGARAEGGWKNDGKAASRTCGARTYGTCQVLSFEITETAVQPVHGARDHRASCGRKHVRVGASTL